MGANNELLELMEVCGHFLYHRRGGKRGQAKVLRILSEQEQISQKQLQDSLDIKSGSLSELVRKMEAENLIVRQRDENDRRNYRIQITERGRVTAAENTKRLRAQEEILFNALSRAEQEQLYCLLSKLLQAWRQQFEEALFQHRKGRVK